MALMDEIDAMTRAWGDDTPVEQVVADAERFAGNFRASHQAEAVAEQQNTAAQRLAESGWVPLDAYLQQQGVSANSSAQLYNQKRDAWTQEHLPKFIAAQIGDEPEDLTTSQGKAWVKRRDAMQGKLLEQMDVQRPGKVVAKQGLDRDYWDAAAAGLADVTGQAANVIGRAINSESLQRFGASAKADAQRIREANFSDETKELMKQEAERKQALAQQFGGADNVPWWEEVKSAGKSFAAAPAIKMAQAFGTSAPMVAMSLLPGGVGVVGTVVAGAALGAANADDTYDTIMKMSHAQIVGGGSPRYLELLEKHGDTEAGRQRAQREFAAYASNLTVPLQALVGAAAARLGLKHGDLALLRPGAAMTARQVAGKVVGEFGQEAVEEGVTQGIGNFGLQQADPNIPLTTGVAGAATEGGLAGAGMAGGFAGLRVAQQRGFGGTPTSLQDQLLSGDAPPAQVSAAPASAQPAIAFDPASQGQDATGSLSERYYVTPEDMSVVLADAPTAPAVRTHVQRSLESAMRNGTLEELAQQSNSVGRAAQRMLARVSLNEADRGTNSTDTSGNDDLPAGAAVPADDTAGTGVDPAGSARAAALEPTADPVVDALAVELNGLVEQQLRAAGEGQRSEGRTGADGQLAADGQASIEPPAIAADPAGANQLAQSAVDAGGGAAPTAEPGGAVEGDGALTQFVPGESEAQALARLTRGRPGPAELKRRVTAHAASYQAYLAQEVAAGRPGEGVPDFEAKTLKNARAYARAPRKWAGRLEQTVKNGSRAGLSEAEFLSKGHTPGEATSSPGPGQIAPAAPSSSLEGAEDPDYTPADGSLNEPAQPEKSPDRSGSPGLVLGQSSTLSSLRGGDGALHRRANVVGLGIAADIERAGSTALVGREVSGADQLAELAQVYRDPRFETFRVFFLKAGRIVHATGVSARLPGQAPMIPAGTTESEYLQQFRDQMSQTGADGYYILHNHPSGDPTPSSSDLKLTRYLAARVPGMKAHVVINSNKFAEIEPGVDEGAPVEDMVRVKVFSAEELLKASKPMEVLGKTLSDPRDLVALGKSLQREGWITLVGRGSDGRVRAVSEAPSEILTRNRAYLSGVVRRFMRMSGSRDVFAVGANSDMNSTPIKAAVASGLLMDAVPEIGQTLRLQGLGGVSNPLEQTPGRSVAEAAASYTGGATAAPNIDGRPVTRDEAITLTANGTARSPTLAGDIAARDTEALKSRLTQAVHSISDAFADSLGPAVRWAESVFSRETANAINGALYRGQGVQQALMAQAMERHGKAILSDVRRMAVQNNIDTRTAQQLAGYYLSAIYAPQANARLIERDRAGVARGDVTTAELQARIDSVNAPDPRATPTRGLAGGLNNAAAALMRANIERRIPPTQLEAFAGKVRDLNAWRLALDIESGKTAPAVAAAFLGRPQIAEQLREFSARRGAVTDAERAAIAKAVRSDYVPLTGAPNADGQTDVFGTGTSVPNTARDRAMEGRTDSIAEDGLAATWAGLSRSATHAGFQDYKRALNAAYEQALADADGNVKAARERTGLSRTTENILAGPSDDVVIYREGGQSYVFRFEDQAAIDAIKRNNVERPGLLLELAGTPTRWFAYTATQLNLTFAPVNWFRDAWEKSENIRIRQVSNAQGGAVDMDAVARRMLALNASPDVWGATARKSFHGLGAAAGETPAAKALDELIALGGVSTWGNVLSRTRTDLAAEIERAGAGAATPVRTALNAAKEAVHGWNNSFELVSSLTAFMAMREAGVDARQAAEVTLNLMNFRKRGEIMAPVRVMYAFAQPVVTGGAALANMLSTRKGQARFLAYTVAGMALYSALRAAGGDDEAGKKIDNLGNFTLERSIPVPVGNGIVKIPLGFGLPQLAWAFATNLVKMGAGEQTAGQTFAELAIKQNLKTFSPIQPSDIDFKKNPMEYLVVALTPTLLRPAAQVAVNRSAFGSPIVYPLRDNRFHSEQGRDATADFYKDAATELRTAFGIDLAPEQVRVLIDGLAVGPLRTALQVGVANPNNERLGRDTRIPFLSQFVDTYNPYAVRARFDEAVDTANNVLREVQENPRTAEERKALAWLDEWKRADNALKSEKRAVTRAKMKPDATRARYNVIAVKREKAQADFLYRWRTMQNLETTRTTR